MKTLFLYHAKCPDGFGAAFAAWLHSPKRYEFMAVEYDEPPPDVRDRDVILADFCYPQRELERMSLAARTLTVLDHHKSARDYLPALIESGHVQGVFDNSRSGALITWDYLHPDKPAPWLIQAISDRDLWQWKLDWSADALCALDNLEFDFCSWNALLQDGKAAAIRNGRLLRTDFERHLARIMDQGRDMQAQIAGFTVPALNAPHQFASHAGNLLCSGQSFALVWSDQRNGRRFSLRSTDAGEDVEIIAKRFGGGGHRNASGFVLPWHRVHEVRIEPKFVGLTPDGKYPSTCD